MGTRLYPQESTKALEIFGVSPDKIKLYGKISFRRNVLCEHAVDFFQVEDVNDAFYHIVDSDNELRMINGGVEFGKVNYSLIQSLGYMGEADSTPCPVMADRIARETVNYNFWMDKLPNGMKVREFWEAVGGAHWG